MNRSELLNELRNIYIDVSTDPIQIDSFSSTKKYVVNVLESGLSSKTKKPVGIKKNIYYYVYNEGQENESAYYENNEPINTVDTYLGKGDSLYNIYNIYSSSEIRNRVTAAVSLCVNSIFLEDRPFSNIIGTVQSNSYEITVDDSNYFYPNKSIIITDTLNTEENVVDRISDNKIYLKNKTVNNYSDSNLGKITCKDNIDRIKWALFAINNTDKVNITLSALVATDESVQNNGNDVTDATLISIIKSYISKLSAIYE